MRQLLLGMDMVAIGTGTMGTLCDLLNEDRKNAVENIVEQKAEERDPEDRDGNLPDLGSGPKRGR
jgi:hypothetical protein